MANTPDPGLQICCEMKNPDVQHLKAAWGETQPLVRGLLADMSGRDSVAIKPGT
jgi:hypothetical protein